ncbi:MAG TPA: helicase-associated domain-containing protein [Pseudolysinimonas sp.]|nr:helicase-associated domain-containing protein [Pseudolysinimonas sp.]
MAATSGSALALAARLRALDDHALERLVARRAVRDSRIHDFFDLAEALLDRTSIQAALQRLDRGTLALLAVAGELTGTTGAPTAAQLADRLNVSTSEIATRAAAAIEAGLLAEESGHYAPWDAVVDQLQAWPSFGLPAASALVDAAPPAVLEPVSESDSRFVDRGAGDRAFGTLAAVTEIVLAVRDQPARRLSRGGVALPDARRLATAADVEPDSVELLLDIAGHAGLVDDAADWTTRDAAAAWLASPRVERWGTLAAGWLDRLPDELHELLRQRAHAVWGDGLLDYLEWRYPAGGDWIRDAARQAAHEAELLGITGASTPSTPGAALLEHGEAAAVEAMSTLFPADVSQVYVQHDLSIIAPGPLAATVDSRLRTIADIDGRGLATSYRVTAASITRGLTAGETADSIREFLAAISLTGIPQPLDYLLADTSARFGTLRVGALDPGAADDELAAAGIAKAASYVRSVETALLDQLVVDPNLTPLGLQRVGDRVVSRFDATIVFWTLADARYPVVAENAAGEITELKRERRAGASVGSDDDTVSILVQRVRAGAAIDADETEQGWMARQLELAIRTKLPVTVTVRLPNGSEMEYLLEPTGLANGRLRARDRKADIERTLPLGAITAVSPLD